jgi:hypothetical protein
LLQRSEIALRLGQIARLQILTELPKILFNLLELVLNRCGCIASEKAAP